MTWSRFISAEIILFAIATAIGGAAAWSDVKSDIVSNATKIEEQEKRNTERYEALKDGQEHIQELLERMLMENRQNDN